jgi:curved DNA-binding protein CbpA
MDPYEILGVPRDADSDTIKKAYRAKSSENHPDKGGTGAAMALVNRANDILTDPDKRARYDRGEDTDPKDVNVIAREKMLHLVLQIIDAEPDAPVLARARECMQVHQQKLASTKVEVQQKIKQLSKRLNKFKRKKGGDNFIQNALLDKIAGGNDRLKMLDAQRAEIDLILKMLGEYEEERDEAPASWGPISFTFSTGSTA